MLNHFGTGAGGFDYAYCIDFCYPLSWGLQKGGCNLMQLLTFWFGVGKPLTVWPAPLKCFHDVFQLRPVVTFFSRLFQSSTMFLFPRLPKISNFEGFITTNDICKLLIGSTGYDYLKSCGLSEAQLAATHDSEEKANLLRSLDVSFVPSKRRGKMMWMWKFIYGAVCL